MGTIVIGASMLVAGLVAVIFAMEFLGRAGSGSSSGRLRTFHKVFGFIFSALFLFLFVGMIKRFPHGDVFSSRANLHLFFGMFALALLIVKILVAARYKKLYQHLFTLGVFLFVVTFAFNAMVIGTKLGARFKPVKESAGTVSEQPLEIGQKALFVEKLIANRCTQCHPLGNVLFALKTYPKAEKWNETVDRMKSKTNSISESDAQKIKAYFPQFY